MKKNLISTVLILCTILTGCNSTPSSHIKNSQNATKEILQMTHYKKDINGVIFDAEVFIGNNVTENDFVKTTASMVLTDGDQLKGKFFSDKKIEENHVNNGINDLGKATISTSLMGENKSFLAYKNNSTFLLFRNNNFVSYINNSFHFTMNFDNYNAHKYSTEKNFSFATQEEAFKNIKNTMLSVGLDIGNNYKAYALDYETMKEEEYAIDEYGKVNKSLYKPSWTESDNCYYFIIRPTINNIPCYYKTSSNTSPVMQDYLAPLHIIYTKDGIQYINLTSLFTHDDTKEKVTLAPFDEIAEVVAKPYTNMLGDNKYKVTKAELVYKVDTSVTSEKYPANLIWVFKTEEMNDKSEAINVVETLVDAVTGKELINGK